MTDQHTDQQTNEQVYEFLRRLKARIDSDPSMTATSLATKAGLDNGAIRNLFSRKAKAPRMQTVLQIMDALGTTYEEFMGDPKTPEEREILRLVSRLPVPERMQLLGFAKALAGTASMTSRPASAGNL